MVLLRGGVGAITGARRLARLDDCLCERGVGRPCRVLVQSAIT